VQAKHPICPTAARPGQEAFEDKPVRRKTGDGQGQCHRTRAGHTGDVCPRFHGGSHGGEAWVGDPGGAGIGDEGNHLPVR